MQGKSQEPSIIPNPAISTLVAEDLVKSYHGRRVVDGVGFSVNAGEVVGLLGKNGAGKTTSFYMVVGLIRPEAGRVLLMGRDIGNLPMYQRARQGINYLPQETSIFQGLTVEQNLMAIAETLPLSQEARRERVDQLMKELGVTGLAGNKATTLSGGERRRVEIARSLVTQPRIILMDEPFAGIDPIAVADIHEIIRELKSRGIGILLTDHNVHETLKICDRATIINEGQTLCAGTPAEIVNNDLARKFYLGQEFRM